MTLTSHISRSLKVINMYRRGTVAATDVAKLPQADRRGTLPEPAIRLCAQNAADLQRPNLRFAGYRGLQLPSHHHTSARHMVTRLVMAPNAAPGKWHGNWIISEQQLSSGLVETVQVD